MKTKTYFRIQDFSPANPDDYAYIGQISDHPDFPARIGRILVIEDYNISHRAKRITLQGYLIHIDLNTLQRVSSFKDSLEDWIVSNQYKVVDRDGNGFMIQNPNFIPENQREEGVEYTENQLQEFMISPAFKRFSRMMKSLPIPAPVFMAKIVEMDDLFNNLFDIYGNIQEYLLNKPLEFKNPV